MNFLDKFITKNPKISKNKKKDGVSGGKVDNTDALAFIEKMAEKDKNNKKAAKKNIEDFADEFIEDAIKNVENLDNDFDDDEDEDVDIDDDEDEGFDEIE